MIRITYEDGSVDVMGTDASWLVSENAIRSSEIYMGETLDLTLPLSENYAGDSQAVLLEKMRFRNVCFRKRQSLSVLPNVSRWFRRFLRQRVSWCLISVRIWQDWWK